MFQKQLMDIPEDHVLVQYVYSHGDGTVVVRFDGIKFLVNIRDLIRAEEPGEYYIPAEKLQHRV